MSKMRKNIQDIYKVLSTDETLLRLLHYIGNTNDSDANSPLNSSKPNILDMAIATKWDIIQDVIKTSKKVKDLDSTKKCRVLIYPGKRSGTRNYLMADQKFIIDVLVEMDINDVDQRMAWICDTINDLIFDQKVTGVGKIGFEDGGQIGAPEGYEGYRLIYEFGSVN